VGIHIAAPALGIAPGSPLDQEAATRLSTVYMPGGKITMLPERVIAAYTLAAGREVPAVSLYLDVAPDFSLRGTRSCVERVRMAANLRHEALEAQFNEETIAADARDFAFADALYVLAGLTKRLEDARGRPDIGRVVNLDYNFYVENDRVRIVERKRGSVVDRLVAELMIFVNAHWGGVLGAQGIAAIYRAQTNGKTRMTTQPAPHQGLGVAQYAWSSSPLRRYVDLINQRQLLAWLRAEVPPYAPKSEVLLTAMRDFEQAYEAYAEFQRNMERYWCLRWLLQEGVTVTTAEVMKEELAKIGPIPLLARVPSLPSLTPGTPVQVAVSAIDLLELTLQVQYRRPADDAA
jgi:exoribonuclease-2